MSVNSSVIQPGIIKGVRSIPHLRYAAGSAVIMLVAMAADYNLSYLTPVLALNFLVPGATIPSLKSGFGFIITIGIASLSGIMFASAFLDFPMVFIPLIGLAIFLIYYTARLQKMKIWLIISLLLIPMVAIQSASLAVEVAVNLFVNAVVAITMVWLVYLIFPSSGIIRPVTGNDAKSVPSARQRYHSALKLTLIVMPVIILFFIFNWSDAMLVLIFIPILSMNPAMTNRKAGLGIILANLAGGLAAIIGFNLLTIVPNLAFLGLLVFLAGLLFAGKLFSGMKLSSLYGMAFSTFVLILGNVTAFTGEAGEKVWTRVLQLAIVVIYIVVAFALADSYLFRKMKVNSN